MINTVNEVNKDFVKNFYGKAKIIEFNGVLYLKSYKTIVCAISGNDFVRFWDDYSATTQNHINAFRALYGFEKLNKKAWDNIPISTDSIPYQVLKVDMKYKTNYPEFY